MHYVKIACDNTAREKAPLYALWLLAEKATSFAAGVNREDLIKGAQELHVALDEHIAFVIQAMTGIADTSGLDEASAPNVLTE